MSKTKRYFGTDGIRGKFGVAPITPDFALKLGWAAGRVLARENQGPVLIGKDTRISGGLFETALEAGLVTAGVDVIHLGTMPTPAVAFLTRHFNAQAGIVISASHNPYTDNGIKFFSREGKKLDDALELAIEAMLEEPPTPVMSEKLGCVIRQPEAAKKYLDFCLKAFPEKHDLTNLKIVLDCAHGATYDLAPRILRSLGASVTAIGITPNGLNINAGYGSTAPGALSAAVLETGADVGIAFDGDGDRLIMVDHRGEIVDGDELLYILAASYHGQQRLSGGVVGTQMSNLGLELGLKKLNIPFLRAKVGDRHVLEQLNQQSWNLGGEGSGHLICLDKTTTGDGLIACLQVLAEMRHTGQPLYDLKLPMQKFDQVLLNVPSQQGQNIVEHPTVKEVLEQGEVILAGQGRILLRASGTEPVVRVMVEGADKQMIMQVAETLAAAVQKSQIA